MKSELRFYGGVGDVTGANFMLATEHATFLVDCGLLQGHEFANEANAAPFAYDPKTVDQLYVTHAHADHIGRIPKLVRDGFSGTIYSTTATRALARVMLADAHKVMHYEHERFGTPLLYDTADIEAAFALWQGVEYHETIIGPDGVSVILSNAGHILGSAIIRFTRGDRSIVFTGDIGNVPQPLLAPPDIPDTYQYLVMESVYGDRLHEGVEERSAVLRHYLEATREKQGTLLIPAFSLERTQAMLYEINNFVEQGLMEPLPVYLDSPLAIEVTRLYREFPQYMNESVQAQIGAGDDIFSFPQLSVTETNDDSRTIDYAAKPKVIIAGSGMSHGGRIRRHEVAYLEDKSTTLLLVGHQVSGSLGRRLQDGAKMVEIDGESIQVRAEVARLQGFSGHADRDQLLEFVAGGGGDVETVFVTMGEEHASLFLTQRLRDYLGVNARAPESSEVVTIDF